MIKDIEDISIINDFLKQFDTSIDNLEDPFKKYVGFKKNDKIASFLNYSLIYDRIEIEYIYTISEYRNHGLASKLLDYLVDLGVKNKCENITLEVKKSNFTAIKFYEKKGFKKISIRENYYNGEDAIMMLRELV